MNNRKQVIFPQNINVGKCCDANNNATHQWHQTPAAHAYRKHSSKRKNSALVIAKAGDVQEENRHITHGNRRAGVCAVAKSGEKRASGMMVWHGKQHLGIRRVIKRGGAAGKWRGGRNQQHSDRAGYQKVSRREAGDRQEAARKSRRISARASARQSAAALALRAYRHAP